MRAPLEWLYQFCRPALSPREATKPSTLMIGTTTMRSRVSRSVIRWPSVVPAP